MDQKKVTPNEKKDFFHRAGDKIERLGEKMIKSGATKAGKFVYDAGDKIEHMRDKK